MLCNSIMFIVFKLNSFNETSESALLAFVISRIFIFASVYFHRTARAFDISVSKILPNTMEYIGIGNPIKEDDSYKKYLDTTEYSLFSDVKKCSNSSDSAKKAVSDV